MSFSPKKRFVAFTLSETLITLLIIGIVASILIPPLNNGIQDMEYKTAYKKVFSVANQAYNGALAQGEVYEVMSAANDGVSACKNWQIFSSQFQKTKECINNDNAQCWASGGETSNGAPASYSYAFIDNSGVAWSQRGDCSTPTCTVNRFLVDTNGFKKPNKYGKDRWVLLWDTNKITLGNGTDTTDFVETPSAFYCPSGTCYYQSWLLN